MHSHSTLTHCSLLFPPHAHAQTDDALMSRAVGNKLLGQTLPLLPAPRPKQQAMATHIRDNNNNGSCMQPHHADIRASVPWPPKDAPVTVTVHRWRRTYRKYHYGLSDDIDIAPAHIEYVVEMHLGGAAAATGDDSRIIIVVSAWRVCVSMRAWSLSKRASSPSVHVVYLLPFTRLSVAFMRCIDALSPTKTNTYFHSLVPPPLPPQPYSAGLTSKPCMLPLLLGGPVRGLPAIPRTWGDKLAAGKDTTFNWGSSLKSDLADKRLSVIGPYLEALLAEPRLRTNPLVTAFLAQAVAFADCDPAIISIVTTPSLDIPAVPDLDAEETDSNRGKGLYASANHKVCAVLAALGHSKPLRDVSPLIATEKEEKIMHVMQLLLLDGHLATPFFANQDLRQLAQTRKAWRNVVEQVVTLRPRSVHMLASRRQALLRRRITNTWDQIRDFRSGALPLHGFRTQAAREHHQDAGWAPLLSALEQGKARHLKSLDLAIHRRDDWGWRPLLTCASACRLEASLRYMPHLLHLNLCNNKIGTAGAIALAKGLQHTPQLRSLSLTGSNIGDEGVQAIAGVLHKIPELESLELGWCATRYPAAKQLASCFKYLPRLKHLVIWRYCLDEGMPILQHLQDLPELQSLSLTRGLPSEAIEILGQQLRRLPKLSKLELNRSFMSENTMSELAAMLRDVPSLKEIVLWNFPLFLTAQMCVEFKCALEAQGFREFERVPGQMDAQRRAQDLELENHRQLHSCPTLRYLHVRRIKT